MERSRVQTAPAIRALARALIGALVVLGTAPARADSPKNDYPPVGRVEYVQSCLSRSGGALADLYKCACVIDRIADRLTWDEYVEASTFAKYSGLGGEAGGIFRDTEEARAKARGYRELEAQSWKACGMQRAPGP